MPRNIVLKFMIPTIAVVGIVMIVLATTVVHMMSTEVRDRARTQAASEADRAMDLLRTVDAMSADSVRASMQVLMREAEQLGAPTLDGTASIAGQSLPDLRLGATSQVGTFALVDLIKKLTGNTATLFVRQGDRYVRVSTNVLKPDGARAVGTPLDPAGRAFAAISAKQAFYGVVDILGSPYMTGYEPMRNAAGTIIGIWYVGLPLASLADLGRHITGARILDNGYVALLQGKRVIFHSAHVGDEAIQRASEAVGRDGWTIITRPYEKWGYTLQVAYPESDIDGEISSTRALVTMFAVVTALLVVVVLFLLIKRLIVRPVLAAVHTARQIAEGELRSQVQITANDEIGQLQTAMKDMAARLADTIGEVRAATNALSSASTEVAHTATDVSQGASTQATAVEQTRASLAEMSASIAENAENSRLSAEMVTRGAKDAEDSGTAVAETVTAMKTIAEKVQVIEEIARRTDLLALNAAVEAARAGDHGKGFAVVASEVRKLAERSQTAARGISGVARNSVAIATRSEQLIKALVATIKRTAELVQSVAAASSEQTAGVQQIDRAMAEVDQITQRNSSGAEKLAATAEQMSTQADVLQQLMAWFKLADDPSTDTRALADIQRYGRPLGRTERATPPRRPQASRSAAASVGVSRSRNRA